MRDLCEDLRDRAVTLAQRIGAENDRFERMLTQLKQEQTSSQEHLRAQLRLANKVIEFIDWQARLQAELGRRMAAADLAETFIKQSFNSEPIDPDSIPARGAIK